MKSEADEIRRRMADVRQEMNEDVVVLVESARSLLDWKGYITAHPVLTLGAACATGFALIPKKKIRTVEASNLEGLLDGKRVVITNPDKLQPKKSLLGGAMTALAGLALRTAVAKTTRHFQDSFSANMTKHVSHGHVEGESLSQFES